MTIFDHIIFPAAGTLQKKKNTKKISTEVVKRPHYLTKELLLNTLRGVIDV